MSRCTTVNTVDHVFRYIFDILNDTLGNTGRMANTAAIDGVFAAEMQIDDKKIILIWAYIKPDRYS